VPRRRTRGTLQFGTELVTGAEGTIAGLLGASTAVSAMLTLLERCFPDRIPAWRPALREAVPSYGRRLSQDAALLAEVRADTKQVLELTG
jgi:malate dehydrogenase (quinone)